MTLNTLTPPACRVCGQAIEGGLLYLCPACATPHHADCWQYNGGCSIFGCVKASLTPVALPPDPTRSILSPEFSAGQKIVMGALLGPALGLAPLGLFVLSQSMVLGTLLLLLSGLLAQTSWRYFYKPLALTYPWVGTLFCLGLGTGATILFVLATLITLLGIFFSGSGLDTYTLALSVLFYGLSLGLIRQTIRLFKELGPQRGALPESSFRVIAQEDPPLVKPPPPPPGPE